VATLQDVLDRAEALDDKLRLQSGESQVTKALTISKMALEYIEQLIAAEPWIETATSDVTATADTETTSLPDRTLRVDGMELLRDSDSLPEIWLQKRQAPGSPTIFGPYIWNLSTTSRGTPLEYNIHGDDIYWGPQIPSEDRTVRVYGYFGQDTSTWTAGTTWPLPDVYMNPCAQIMVAMFSARIDDPELKVMALNLLDPVFKARRRRLRDGPPMARYGSVHTA